jgi:phosphoglycerate dehydrogenase-like enzyme
LLAESDFVCLAVPLSQETTHLIGAKELAAMKPSAFLINISRGKVIDEKALIEALRNNAIRGAGLDVYEQEPLPTDSPLIELPSATTAPHIGSATKETRDAMAAMSADNLIQYLVHHKLQNAVNPEAVPS